MPARLSAFLVWALVAASATFWALRLIVTGPKAPPNALAVMDGAPARVDLTKLLGAPPVAATPAAAVPALNSRFVLTGVMAPKRPGDPGVALIAVDGKMARAFRVGAAVDGDLVLQSVSLRTASIGPTGQPAAAVLELPALPPPATGVLPPATAMTPPAAGPAPVVPATPTPVAPVSPLPPVQRPLPQQQPLPGQQGQPLAGPQGQLLPGQQRQPVPGQQAQPVPGQQTVPNPVSPAASRAVPSRPIRGIGGALQNLQQGTNPRQ